MIGYLEVIEKKNILIKLQLFQIMKMHIVFHSNLFYKQVK